MELSVEYNNLLKKYNKLKRAQSYGLMWEKDDTRATEYLRDDNKLPLLKYETSLKTEDNDVTHIVIKGENFDALSMMKYSHTIDGCGIIDFIYIDPPYNRGKDDLIYKDKYTYQKKKRGKGVDKEDTYYHSKWLNFMENRLRFAYDLLKDTGIMAISIDSNELYNLKLLCDKIFGPHNYRGNIIRKENAKKQKVGKPNIKEEHEYLLIYSKSAQYNIYYTEKISYKEYEKTCNDIYKILKKYNIDNIDVTFNNLIKGMSMPNFYCENGTESVNNEIFKKLKKIFVLQATDKGLSNYVYFNDGKSFRAADISKYAGSGNFYKIVNPFNKNSFLKMPKRGLPKKNFFLDTGDFMEDENGNIVLKYPENIRVIEIDSKNKKRYLYSNIAFKTDTIVDYVYYLDKQQSMDSVLLSFMGSDAKLMEKMNLQFDYPKPKDYIKYLIRCLCPEDGIVLDFFAGSGTTGHAVLELNSESTNGKKRRFIVCTNNENNICDNVTIPRLKKCVYGYNYETNNRGNKKVNFEKGLNGNINFYEIDYLDIEKSTPIEVKESVALNCFDILSIRENTLNKVNVNYGIDTAIYYNSKKIVGIYVGINDYKATDCYKYLSESDKPNKIIYLLSYTKLEDYIDNNITVKYIPIELIECLSIEGEM